MTEFNTPKHYKLSDGSDSMDALAKILGPEEFKGFLRGNALKYLIRYAQKGGIEDLKKARDYINRLIATVGKTDENDLRSVAEVADAIIKVLGDKSEEEKTIAEKLFNTCKKYRLHLNVKFDSLGTRATILYGDEKFFLVWLDRDDGWFFIDEALAGMPKPMAEELFKVCKDYAEASIKERRKLISLFQVSR